MKATKAIVCIGLAFVVFASVGNAFSAESLESLPKELAKEDDRDCRVKPGEFIDISIQCYYDKLQSEIRRNQKIRELISNSMEEMAREFSEPPTVVSHLAQAHQFWLAYGEMTCETVPREISQNKSKYEVAEETGCWLELYHVYTENLLRGYGQVVLREYNRARKVK